METLLSKEHIDIENKEIRSRIKLAYVRWNIAKLK